MSDIIKALQDARVPTILVVAGIFFLFLAIGGGFGATIITDRVKPRYAGIISIVLLVGGMALAVPVSPPPSPTVVATVTLNAPAVSPTDTVVPSATNTSMPTSTPAIPISAPISTNTPTPICVLESFESGRQMKWWTPNSNVFDYRETSEAAHSGTQSFKVKYDKTDTYQFIGAELPTGFCDFAKGHTLQVWVYGKVILLLKLEDQNLGQVDISEQRSTEATGWTLLTFNYTTAGTAIDLSRIRSIFLFPAPADASASGEFFLDDIAVFP